MTSKVKIEPGWGRILSEEFKKPYFADIRTSLKEAKKQGKIIYPPGPQIFEAFNRTPIDQVKVVIIGQDPYHGPKQAMGLCFSVSKSVAIPASLRNIYKEIKNDLGHEPPNHGDLSSWADQGVLMLNTVLTVEHGQAGSHRKIGWINFTDRVIQLVSEHRSNVVFLLWGNYAKGKKNLIDELKHHIVESAHPSPLAGNRFMNNHHFSTTNKLLMKNGLEPINWEIK